MEIPQDSQFPSPPVSPQKRTEDINPRVVHTTIESFEESEEPGIVKTREKLSELYLQDTSGLQESYDSSSPRSRASSSVSSAAAYPPYIPPVGTRSAQGISAEGELGSSYYKIGGVQTGLEGKRGRDSGTIVGEPVLNVSYNADSELYDRRVPYIQGFSNGEEITEQQNLNLSGSLPTWLNGAFYRIGPGIFDIEYLSKRKNLRVFSFDHWYDGLSLVHRFEVNGKENQIKYRSRFTSNGVEATVRDYARDYKKVHGTDPNAIAQSYSKQIENDPSGSLVNMNIIPDFPLGRSKGGDHLICLTDASLLQEIDPITLIPKRVFRYSDINPLFQGDGAPAVVQRDEREKETIAYSLSPTKGTYNIFSILDEDHFEPPGHMIASVQAKPTYAHSFALTKNYVIIVVYPFSAGLGSLRLYWARNYRDALRFDHSSPMYFHIIDREKRDQICIFKAPACFALNVVNAWEESDGSICVDLNAYDDDTIAHCFGLRNLRTLGMPPFPPGTVRRYVLSKVPEAAAIYKIRKNEIPEAGYTHRTDFSVEFPRINPNCHMRHHQYAYGISISVETRTQENSIWDTIVKADLSGKTRTEWKESGCYPSETLMIPDPEAPETEEDKGILISVVLDTKVNRSFILFLDARDLNEIARAYLPCSVPFGFHGSWTRKMLG